MDGVIHTQGELPKVLIWNSCSKQTLSFTIYLFQQSPLKLLNLRFSHTLTLLCTQKVHLQDQDVKLRPLFSLSMSNPIEISGIHRLNQEFTYCRIEVPDT